MLTIEKQMTADEFWEFCSLPENRDRFWELVKGVIVEMSAAGFLHSLIAMFIAVALSNFVRPRDLGYVTGEQGGYIIERFPDTVRAPDVAFIGKERAVMTSKFAPVPPDLAVEVISPNDSWKELRDKALEYLRAGVRMVWLVDPVGQTAEIYRPADDGSVNLRVIGIDGVLEGVDVLPGFSLAMRDLFATTPENTEA